MDWSGLDNGFLEDNHQPAENLVRKTTCININKVTVWLKVLEVSPQKLATPDSFFSLSSREPLMGGHSGGTDFPSPLPRGE